MAKRGSACSVLQHMEQVVSIQRKRARLCEICLAKTYSILPTLCSTKKAGQQTIFLLSFAKAPSGFVLGEMGSALTYIGNA